MIDFASRVDELVSYLDTAYGIGRQPGDRDAIELLLAVQVDMPDKRPAPKLCIDTDWLSRDCVSAWFAFGGAVEPHALGEMLMRRVRAALDLWRRWEEESEPFVLVDAEWRTQRVWHKINIGYCLDEKFHDCLRVRARSPKSLGVLTADGQADRRAERLRYLTREAVVSAHRAAEMPALVLPDGFAYYCELALKLARPGAAWEWMVNALARSMLMRARLYNKMDTSEEAAWAGRVLAWQVAPWTGSLLRAIAESREQCISKRLLANKQGTWRSHVGHAAGLMDIKKVRAELRRLTAAGVLRETVDGWEGSWRVNASAEHVVALLDGRAFG